ncbi:MAG: NAD(P)-dependent oxidoreductase [Lactobacillaceae bacterium]|jgi:3-hydroxyisobutyrate dehydrogenase|nr:NAD(P)-dependent oxidoreductase [Lactobacillaceae bacterium]
MNLGFIGTGVMGTGVVNNLLAAGHQVTVYNRTKAHAQTVLDNGANWADNPKAVAQVSEIVFTMVGYPKDVEEQYLGENGLFAGTQPNQLFVDMTTSTPTLAQELARTSLEYDVEVVDAPVSGGDVGAREGTLSIMFGGSEEAFNRLIPIFEVIGSTWQRFGDAGMGQHAKMANQIMNAGSLVGIAESLIYAKTAGLNLPQMIESIHGGTAQNRNLDIYGQRILDGDFKPGFYAKHLLKDLRIALDEAKKMNLNLPMTELAEKLYAELSEEKNLGDDGVQALIKLYGDLN